MRIHLLLFASLREALGVSEEHLEVPDSVCRARDVLAILRARGGAWEQALADSRRFRIAVDQRLGDRASPVRDGSELALFPPVTGG